MTKPAIETDPEISKAQQQDIEKLEDLESHLFDMRARLAFLERELEQAKLYKEELDRLTGGVWRRDNGEIDHVARNVAQTKQRIQNRQLPLVYWKEKKLLDQNEIFVIERVTAKRIFVKRINWDRLMQFDREGVECSSYKPDKIDMEATFGPDWKTMQPIDYRKQIGKS